MRLLSLVALLSVILLGANSQPEAVTTTPDYVGVVERVIDGDTIVIADGVHVRLLSIDTPELDTYEGIVARSLMLDLVEDSSVSLFCDGWDKYDRWLCDVIVDGVNVADILLNHGLARVWVD